MLRQEPKKQQVFLSGYGVELAIKNTEYKAMDDAQVKGLHHVWNARWNTLMIILIIL